MLSFYSQAKHHFIILSLLKWQLELLLLPSERHLWKPYQISKNLHLYNIVMVILKTQRLTVVVLIVIRITPPIAIQQITPVPNIFVVVKLKLVSLHCSLKHYPHQHPWSHVKSCQLHKYLSFCLPHFNQPRPIHLLVPRLHHSVTHPEQMFARIRPQNILCFDLSGF